MPKRHRTRFAPNAVYSVIKSDRDNPDVSLWEHEGSPKYEIMDDVVTPGYNKIIAQGGIVNHGCRYSAHSHESGGGSVYFDHNTTSYWFSYDGDISYWLWDYYSSLIGTDPPEASFGPPADWSKVRAIANIDSTPYAFAEDAFEIRETLRFLRSPLRSILRLVRLIRSRARRLSKQRAISISQALAEIWLQYRFAVRPLLMSIMDLSEAAGTVPRTPPKRRNARGFHSESHEHSWSNDIDTWFFDHKKEESYDIKASVLYEVTNPLYDTAWKYGLRVKDVPRTLWEVIPYSFMVDRVVEIGTAVSAFTNLLDPEVKILAGSHRTKQRVNRSFLVTRRDKTGYTVTTTCDPYTREYFVYSRSIWWPSVRDIVPPTHVGDLVRDAQSILDLVSLILANTKF